MPEFKSSDGVVVWTDDNGKIEAAWTGDGVEAIPDTILKHYELGDLVKVLQAMVAEGKVMCSMCGHIMTREEIDHRHYAGLYCKDCGPKYRAKHTRICGTCGSPDHSCCC